MHCADECFHRVHNDGEIILALAVNCTCFTLGGTSPINLYKYCKTSCQLGKCEVEKLSAVNWSELEWKEASVIKGLLKKSSCYWTSTQCFRPLIPLDISSNPTISSEEYKSIFFEDSLINNNQGATGTGYSL